MNKQTVYIPIEITKEFWKKFDSGEIPDYEIISCSNGERLDEWVDSKEGYFFTPEELKQLLSDTFDAGNKSGLAGYSNISHHTQYDKQQYTENLLNK
jgi:hypothetical protein